MKVLMFSWEYPPHMVGGLGQHVFDLSRFLIKQGVEVHVITPSAPDCLPYQNENGVHIYRVGKPALEGEHFKSWIFSFNSEAIRAAVCVNDQIGGFDIVHAHDWLVAYAGRSVSKIFSLPLVTTIHATEHGRNLGLHNRMQLEINEIEKNLALEADQVICCSRYMQNEVSTLFGIKKEAIYVIPNGVDPELFKKLPSTSPYSYVGENEKAVVFLGRLVPEKGVMQLIQAFSQVVKKVPLARLYIGGRGPQREILEKEVARLGLEEKVVFTGFIGLEDRNLIYKRASLAVFPSLYEPFGIVALEAMVTDTPVIVGNVGGLAEIVEDGVTGLKVNALEIDKLADAMVRLLTDELLAEKLKRNAREKVKNVYSWEAIAKSTADVYREVLRVKQKVIC
ncbi:Glycosyltransferase involved in cell wall bisynthesis [Thermosyntropha lipolytica DSM 11003]|uniref:Glycosyltransferase involved in cell wall bisynthesis n=1 Tax=Thermosyntropha lipolytica DSM 11003 TaxID=1123382 RepID=A0A1M5PFK7_9FIRM|nr:glycosyltransferase family 4 protein [Thermosyntropha lipolytica]SHH00518.1 Glycosyltransferase involved in cell wall bisynthesis [Thermosyntropha lipolytica DSM 11003]